MTVDPDDAQTRTAGARVAGSAREAPLTVLRWVTPGIDRVTVLGKQSVLLGRDPSAATRLETALVSRRHAEIRSESEVFVLRDLASKNGVFVNGARVAESPLRPGDVLRLGDAVAVVELLTAEGLPGFAELGTGIFGGAAIRESVKQARQAAKTRLNVLLQGETGTGKECFARALHDWSGRSGSFVAVNSAAYSESTIAAELFGYRKGAFTGAERASSGHVRAAHEGTLLFDEVLELPLELQAKLLRVIEQREVLPLGETQAVGVDVLFVAASQRPLGEAVASGRFRADLRARLEGIVLEIPPLRERRADVVPLFLRLLLRHGFEAPPELEHELVEALCLHAWPMNVRELENIARRLSALHAGEATLKLEHVADWLSADELTPLPASKAAIPRASRRTTSPYTPAEVQALAAALERHRGNVTKAAEELGITRPKAYRMLRFEKSQAGPGR